LDVNRFRYAAADPAVLDLVGLTALGNIFAGVQGGADLVTGPDKFYNSAEIPVNVATQALPLMGGALGAGGVLAADPVLRQNVDENLGNLIRAVMDRRRREEGSTETVRDFYNKRREASNIPTGRRTVPLDTAAKLRNSYRMAAMAALLGTGAGFTGATKLREDKPRPVESLLNAPESEDAPEIAKAKEINKGMEEEREEKEGMPLWQKLGLGAALGTAVLGPAIESEVRVRRAI
jgi:hypothetical protein